MKPLLYITVCFVSMLVVVTAHAGTLRTVALGGQPAPGTPDGVVFSPLLTEGGSSGTQVALNDAGQTAFHAAIRGSGVTTQNYQGIWSEGSGSLALVARSGDQAPGAPDGVIFGPYDNSGFQQLVLNDAGQTAFWVTLKDSGVFIANDESIWSEGSGSLAVVARKGSQAPGLPSGANFRDFHIFNPRKLLLNNSGQTAFSAYVTGGAADGIWSEGSGSLALVAGTGDHAPGTPDGVTFGGSLGLGIARPVLNDAGQIAFSAGTTSGSGIWSDRSGSLALVARSGDQAPGLPSGVNYGPLQFASPVLSNAGQTAFYARLTGSGVDSTNIHSIWSEGSGSLTLVARSGDHAPGTASGVNFDRALEAARFVLNDAGQTAFWASLTGSGVDSTNDFGIWIKDSANLALVAREGDHAPGTPDGETFTGFGSHVLNDAGQIAFMARTIPGGLFFDGIWATDRSGVLQLIARTGDSLEVAPGDFRVISNFFPNSSNLGYTLDTPTGNSDGRRSGFNNRGQLAFYASFTDGTSGIFVSNAVAVPEPSTLLLLSLGSLAVLWRRRVLCRSRLAQQCPKARLLEVMVGGQRVGDAALLHQQKRKAIRQGPVLVGALLVAVQRLVELRSCGWNYFDVRFRLKSANKLCRTDSRIDGRQRIGKFDQDPSRCQQPRDASPAPLDGRNMVLVSGIQQRQEIVGVDKLNDHSPGFP